MLRLPPHEKDNPLSIKEWNNSVQIGSLVSRTYTNMPMRGRESFVTFLPIWFNLGQKKKAVLYIAAGVPDQTQP